MSGHDHMLEQRREDFEASQESAHAETPEGALAKIYEITGESEFNEGWRARDALDRIAAICRKHALEEDR